MNNISIHEVKEVTTSLIRRHKVDEKVFYTKEIKVRKDNGDSVFITLFSNDKDTLRNNSE